MAHINFKLDDDLLEKIDEEALRVGANKSEFYRACLESGFQNLSELKKERKQVFVAFYIDDTMYKKLLQITKKYKLTMHKTYFAVFDTGFDVLNKLDFLGFMRIAQGIVKVDEVIKKIFDKKVF